MIKSEKLIYEVNLNKKKKKSEIYYTFNFVIEKGKILFSNQF